MSAKETSEVKSSSIFSRSCVQRIRESISEDENLINARLYFNKGKASARPKIIKFFVGKVPVIQWLPSYSPSWIINDIVAGLTIGILLVPQSLGYASVANIPGQYGLISSWLPTLIYAIMGTSKDTTSGPTAIMGLLTGDIVKDLVKEGYQAHTIATAVAFMCGIYSLAVGLLRLGFLLDFIPLPVLSGYVSAAAITIVLQQIPTLFGEKKLLSSTAGIIREFFLKLPNTLWRDFLVGFSGLLLLFLLQYVGKRWGKRFRAIWFLSISRNALVLVLYTAISYGVNKDRKSSPLFAISKTTGSGLVTPSVPDTSLAAKVAGRSVAVFIAAALEHLAIGKAFGRKHKYSIDQSQELLFIGVSNFVGSFFSAMPVTGGFSRTAVNSESGVKSPLSGLITTACVLVSIYKLTGAFYWIPKATLSAIIISAVVPIILPARVFLQYWRTSFADFIASMVSFWVTLFVSVEIGIASAVAYSIVYLLLRIAFSQVTLVTSANLSTHYPSRSATADITEVIPEGTQIFKINESILFPNAYRLKTSIIKYVTQLNSGLPIQERPEKERLWSEAKSSQANRLGENDVRPKLQVVILDLSGVNYIDTTGVHALMDLKPDLQAYAGEEVVLKFLSVRDNVQTRFERAKWEFSSEGHCEEDSLVKSDGEVV